MTKPKKDKAYYKMLMNMWAIFCIILFILLVTSQMSRLAGERVATDMCNKEGLDYLTHEEDNHRITKIECKERTQIHSIRIW